MQFSRRFKKICPDVRNHFYAADESSIFTAEAKAVDQAFDFIITCDANNKFCIESYEPYQFKNPQIGNF